MALQPIELEIIDRGMTLQKQDETVEDKDWCHAHLRCELVRHR